MKPPIGSEALNPGVRRREVLAWAMYDFANSGYTTVVLTAVFNAYFVGVVAGNAAWATLAWTMVLAVSHLITMLGMPGLGAYADAHASKKRLLALATVGCVGGTALLAAVGPGDIALAAFAVIVSSVCFSMGESLIAAFLPELARHRAMGRVSGWGWSFGYLGGMLALGLSLAYVLNAQQAGAPATSFVPVTMLITAGIFAIASIPTFAVMRERARPTGASVGFLDALRRLRRNWHEARRYRDFVTLLVCSVFYQAGIAVVVALAAVYAEQAMRFTQAQTMALIFVVNIASSIGAFGFGYAQDRIGHKRALAFTLVVWIAMAWIAALSTTVAWFWVAATLAGLAMGSSQSCGRAIVGLFAPRGRQGEFFGLWTFAVRLASIIGPITYGLVTWATGGAHRIAIAATSLFFIVGLLILMRVDVERGERAAAAGAPDPSAAPEPSDRSDPSASTR